MPRLERSRYPLRRPFDGQLGKGRCVAERCEIAARNSDWRPIGPPETRIVESTARHFPPLKIMAVAYDMRTPRAANCCWTAAHLRTLPANDEAFNAMRLLRRYHGETLRTCGRTTHSGGDHSHKSAV